ncbi:MAG: tetratricopeptide repeat protein [Flexistipes sinusarabici]|uniref:Tetratricopeptide repeat protein n=1 Tax=Flexistipes sinusarabici TaxID=2352 RepID=A0A5D0MM77_FLESI|nr:tetratricopeptide repeat protein [Flexistipes sinusarabici]TYB34106.1 MAG: tetratricopeptide repeat protein [Flexistipes sinusarabici]
MFKVFPVFRKVTGRFIVLLSIIIFGCAPAHVPLNTYAKNSYDYKFLKAEMLLNSGEFKEAADIYMSLAEKTGDVYLYTKAAEVYKQQQEYKKAVEVLKDGIDSGNIGNSAELYYQLAKIYYENLQQFQSARKYIEKAVSIEESDQYLELQADIYKNTNDFSSAIGVYDKLIKKNEDASYFLQRGKLYMYLDLAKKAEEDFVKAVEMEKNLEAALLLADIYLRENQNKKAIKYLKIAQEKHPGLILPELKLAELYMESNRYEEALKYYSQIVDKVSGERKIYVLKQMGKIYLKQNEYKNVIEVLEEAYNLGSDDTQSAFYIALAYEALKEYDKAEKYYKETLKIRSDYTQAKKRLAFVYFSQGAYDKALDVLADVSEVYRDVDFYRIKSAVYERKGNLKKAVDVLNEGLKSNPDSETLLMNKAFVIEKKGDLNTTIDIAKKVLKINDNNDVALNFLAYLYAENDMKLEKALELVNRALEIDGNNPAYLDTKAWIFYKQKRYEQAKEYQIKALNLAPEEKELREHMRAILDAIGINKGVDEYIKAD